MDSFALSPAMRNFSRPLVGGHRGEPGLPARPPKSPLRSYTSALSQPVQPAATSVQQRRRSRSIGALFADSRPLGGADTPSTFGSLRQRTYSTGARDEPQPVWGDIDSRRSSPSSPTTCLPIESEFVARGVRDSVITTESSYSSLYPETFEDDDEHHLDPRIASYHHEPALAADFDPDNVAYRLDLLVKNHYFLPPAHSKPSARELASLGPTIPQPQHVPVQKAPGLLSLFRKGPTRTVHLPAPVVVTAPKVAPPPPRIAVLREQLVDLHAAAREVQQHRPREPQPPLSLDDIDPTNFVDLPPGALAPDPHPATPVLPEDERFRRELLKQAVGLSFSTTATSSSRRSEDIPSRRSRQSSSPNPRHHRRPRTASDAPPVPAHAPALDTRSLHSVSQSPPSSFSPPVAIGAPIFSAEPEQFSTPARNRFNPPTASPSRVFSFPPQPQTDFTGNGDAASSPLSANTNARRLKTLSQTIDTFIDSMHDFERVEGPGSPHTPLSPMPPRKGSTAGVSMNLRATSPVVASLRRSEESRTSSGKGSGSGHAHSASAQTIVGAPLAPEFVLEVEEASFDASETRATLDTAPSVGSVYSSPDAGPSTPRMSPVPPQSRWSLDTREQDRERSITRMSSFETSDHRPSLALSMDPSRPSYDSSARPSFDTHPHSHTNMYGRHSFDDRELSSSRPSLAISTTRSAESVHSLHSDAFGGGSRARRNGGDTRSPLSARSGRTLTDAPVFDDDDGRSMHSVHSAMSGYSTTPAPHSPITRPTPMPAPDVSGPAFFDAVQDAYLTESFARARTHSFGSIGRIDRDEDDEDEEEEMRRRQEEIVHLGIGVGVGATHNHPPRTPSPRANSPLPAPGGLYALGARASSSVSLVLGLGGGSSKMVHTEPVSSAGPKSPRKDKSAGRDKGLGMLQRAQAGSAVSLATYHGPVSSSSAAPYPPVGPSWASEDGHGSGGGGASGVGARPRDDRLEDLLMQHMEAERDRIRRITTDHRTQSSTRPRDS